MQQVAASQNRVAKTTSYGNSMHEKDCRRSLARNAGNVSCARQLQYFFERTHSMFSCAQNDHHNKSMPAGLRARLAGAAYRMKAMQRRVCSFSWLRCIEALFAQHFANTPSSSSLRCTACNIRRPDDVITHSHARCSCRTRG
jgi:hypothetical protein